MLSLVLCTNPTQNNGGGEVTCICYPKQNQSDCRKIYIQQQGFIQDFELGGGGGGHGGSRMIVAHISMRAY